MQLDEGATFVGWDVSVGYLDVLLSFRKNASAGGIEILTWKYVDLNNSLRLLWGGRSLVQSVAFVGLALMPLTYLACTWWRWPLMEATQRQWLWAATVAWLPILNLYVGIYDSIFVVQSLLIAADVLLRERRSENPLTDSGVAYCGLTIAATAWFSQNLARISGVQLYTLALIALGVLMLRLARPDSET